MDFIISTNSFNLNEFKSLNCRSLIKSSSENGNEIKFTIDKNEIGPFTQCLIIEGQKFDIEYQKLANIQPKTRQLNDIIEMEQLDRKRTMIQEILDIFSKNPDVTSKI